MTISVISNTLHSAYASTLLGPRSVQSNTPAQADDKSAQATDGSNTGSGGAGAADSQGKSKNFQAKSASGTQASGSSDSSDPISQTLKQLQQQLRQVMAQIQRVQASPVPDEQKAPQLQALNAEAAALQGQIAALLDKQAQAAKGVITA
jgi:DNA mismatch repair ATPase MutL